MKKTPEPNLTRLKMALRGKFLFDEDYVKDLELIELGEHDIEEEDEFK